VTTPLDQFPQIRQASLQEVRERTDKSFRPDWMVTFSLLLVTVDLPHVSIFQPNLDCPV